MKKNLFNEINEFLKNLGSSKNSSDVNLSDMNDDTFIDDVFLAAYNNTSMIK